MMPTKFSIIIDVLMVYIFMRRGLYSSQHKNIHPSASHYYGLFVFGKRAMQNSRNITRLLLPPLTPLPPPAIFNFHYCVRIFHRQLNYCAITKLIHQTAAHREQKVFHARTHDVNIILHLQAHQRNWPELKSLLATDAARMHLVGERAAANKIFVVSHFASNFRRMIAKQRARERESGEASINSAAQHSRINHFRPRLLCRRSRTHAHVIPPTGMK
jgi:hypothetical protein